MKKARKTLVFTGLLMLMLLTGFSVTKVETCDSNQVFLTAYN